MLGFDNLRSQSVAPPQWTMHNTDDRVANVVDAATEELSLNNTNLCHIEAIAAADGSTNDDQCLPRTDNKLDRNHGDPLVLGTHAKPIEIGSGENTELLAVCRNDALSDKPRSAIPILCNLEKKDGWDLHVSKCDKKNDVELPSIIDDAKLNGDVAPDNEKTCRKLVGQWFQY
ncbi:hypothetical protein IHE45_13G056400 [Dioscorea alata]|uniref:Uncharacterized protein n=1 Tax=Dioscorea alata TaxID=55571 RepID=A0ACB7UY74_DIOAL|nr:hypothetical protein IHE45_13G056400 [Dioscorea alata]